MYCRSHVCFEEQEHVCSDPTRSSDQETFAGDKLLKQCHFSFCFCPVPNKTNPRAMYLNCDFIFGDSSSGSVLGVVGTRVGQVVQVR